MSSESGQTTSTSSASAASASTSTASRSARAWKTGASPSTSAARPPTPRSAARGSGCGRRDLARRQRRQWAASWSRRSRARACDTSHVSVDPSRLTAAVVLGIKDKDTFPLDLPARELRRHGDRRTTTSRALHRAGEGAAHHRHALFDRLRSPHQQRERPRAPDVRTVLDIDYRPVLWGLANRGDGETRFIPSDGVTAHLQTILPKFDLVIGTIEEFNIAGGSLDIIDALRAVRAVTEATLVVKRGPMGCAVIDGAIPATLDDAFNGEGVEVEVLNVLGAGDAFSSGFLSGWVRGEDYDRCDLRQRLRRAGRVAPGLRARDADARRARLLHRQRQPDPAAGPGRDPDAPALRDARAAHAAQTCSPSRSTIATRSSTSRSAGADEARRSALKRLRGGGRGRGRGRTAGLRHAVRRPLRAGCAQRAPPGAAGGSAGRSSCRARTRRVRSRPLDRHLARWPASTSSSAWSRITPTTRSSTASSRRRRSARCTTPCRRAVTSCCSRSSRRSTCLAAEDTVPRSLKRLYNLGIYPEWWKLEPMCRRRNGRTVDALLAERDPYCRGVLLLGLNAGIDTLAAGFPRCAGEPHVPRLRGRPHDLPGAGERVARGIDRRRRTEAADPRELRGADRRVAAGAQRAQNRGMNASVAGPSKARARASCVSRRPGARSLPRRRARRDAARRAAALRRRVGDLRSRQRRGRRRGAVSRIATTLPTYRAHNEQAMAHARHRLREGRAPPADDGLHDVDRPRRHQSRHRRGARARQPAAGAVPARRHLRLARARSRAAAGRGFQRRHDQRQRLLPAGVALLRPHRASRAAARPRCRARCRC